MTTHHFSAILLITLVLCFANPRCAGDRGFSDVAAPRNQDDIWAVIEYPEGQEVSIDLVPTAMMPSAKGTARVVRKSNGADINVDLSGLTAEIESYHLYAIDSLGNATSLGTLAVNEGASSLRTQTALTRFMLLISPKEDIVSLTPDTTIILRSTAPSGFQIVPRANATEAVSEPAAATQEQVTAEPSEYEAPLLGIDSFKRGASTQLNARLFEEIQGARLNVSVTPRKKGPTGIKLLIRDLKPAPDGKHYVLWSLSPEKTYVLLGRVLAGKQTKLDAATDLNDFGLFITLEDTDTPATPTGKMVAMIVKG